MKSKDKFKELKSLNLDALKAKEKEFSEEAFWQKIKFRSGQISNFAGITKIRRDLARVKTIIREKSGTAQNRGKEGAK